MRDRGVPVGLGVDGSASNDSRNLILEARQAIWDVSGLESAGSWDPAALLLAGPMTVKHLFVEGQQIIRDHAFAKLDLPSVIAEQNRLAGNLM